MKKLIKLSLILLTIQLLFTGLFAQDQQKAELVVQTGCFSYTTGIDISPDGKILAIVCRSEIKLIDIESGREIKTLEADSTGLLFPVFSPDGKTITAIWNNVKMWDISTGKLIRQFERDTGDFGPVIFSKNGDLIATWSSIEGNGDFNIWNVKTGKLLRSKRLEKEIRELRFAANDRELIIVADDGEVTFENLITGQTNKVFKLSGFKTASLDGEFLVLAGKDQKVSIWSTKTGKEYQKIDLILDEYGHLLFGSDSKNLITVNKRKVEFWKIHTGEKVREIDLPEKIDLEIIAIDPGGKNLVFEKTQNEDNLFEDSSLTIWDLNKNKERFIYQRYYKPLRYFTFSHNEKFIASNTGDISGARYGNIQLWDISAGIKLLQLNDSPVRVSDLMFSPNDRYLGAIIGTAGFDPDWFLVVWEIDAGKKIFEVKFSTGLPDYFAFSQNSENIITSENEKKTIKLWSLKDGKELKDSVSIERFPETIEHSTSIFEVEFSEIVKLNSYSVTSAGNSLNKGIEIVKDKTILANLIPLNEQDWAVITPEGLFDTSPNARKLLHYVIGLEPISLEQMKDLYYVPGLLQKILKGEPLPRVELFSKKDLFPDVEFSQPKAGQQKLDIKLINRGGGIGQVQVIINGKEFVADARPNGFDSNAKETALIVSLKDAPFISGKENKIEVVAKNASGSLTNRGTRRGVGLFEVDDDNLKKETPNIYAIVGGISDYTGDNLDLSFAAKDAEDFAKAVEIGAMKLLGDRSKVHMRLLTSNGASSNAKFDVPDAKISTATKKNFQKAFADFSSATPNDVFIVYLSGHGVSLNLNQNPNQAGGDTYLYLTQEATTTDKSVLSVKQSREAMSVSSEELKDLMKQNKALKQVLILDTCAAGALSNSLVGKRDLPSDQIRAIERLKDNTGFFVLMGSAANSVSYEASQYGQGLLTYSLLQGMKGAKLRENQFADIGLLFGYAQETVPQMAKNIGGIQRPLIITPDTSASFDIGKFTEMEKNQIALSSLKPLILRPSLRNSALKFDNLKLTQEMTKQLREASYVHTRGKPSQIVFVEADEMSDAIQPVGDYIIEGDILKISVILVKNNQPIGKEISVMGKTNEPEKAIKQIVSEILKAAN